MIMDLFFAVAGLPSLYGCHWCSWSSVSQFGAHANVSLKGKLSDVLSWNIWSYMCVICVLSVVCVFVSVNRQQNDKQCTHNNIRR